MSASAKAAFPFALARQEDHRGQDPSGRSLSALLRMRSRFDCEPESLLLKGVENGLEPKEPQSHFTNRRMSRDLWRWIAGR